MNTLTNTDNALATMPLSDLYWYALRATGPLLVQIQAEIERRRLAERSVDEAVFVAAMERHFVTP